MAQARSRRLDTILCVAAARSGSDQVEPEQAHRRRHRLAVLERDQTRAEGVNQRKEIPMLVTHSRRQFLSMFSLASAASFVRVAAPLAGEPLETTIVRLAYDGTICSPLLVAEELLATEGFAEVRFVNMA